jgi:uncharacterized protein involved in response to NO
VVCTLASNMESVNSAAQHGDTRDAYRVFFPLGILMGIAGVTIWPLYYFGVTSGYSGRAHMFVQADCFLYAFIVGFLWTALPRFTGTSAPARSIQYVLAAMLGVAAACFEAQLFAFGHLLFMASHVIFIAVLVQRFRHRQSPPPPTFALVGAGILAGLIGAAVNAGIAWEQIGPEWDLVGRRMLTEGMVLLLVLGVGGFLGPRLLGFAQLPNFQGIGNIASQSRPPFMVRRGGRIYAVAGVTIVASILLEYGLHFEAMAWLRAAIASILVATLVRPWRLPAARTTLAWCVWVAHWLLIAGLWIVAAAPKYRIDFLHVLFMGSFTLLILAVGTRVALSHGGHTLAQERKSWPLRIGLTTGLIALLARLAAPFTPNSYFDHLAWAALFWICGIAFWGIFLVGRIRQIEPRD